MTITLSEGAVRAFNGTAIGCGNFWPRSYTAADGSTREGLSAELFYSTDDKRVEVGEGSMLEVDGVEYLVISVQRDAQGKGQVGLAPR